MVNQSGEKPYACHGSSCHPFTFYVLSAFGKSYPCEGCENMRELLLY